MANLILPGYTAYCGDKYLISFDHAGPASYTQVGSSGVYSSGGDIINAADIGWGGFDYLEADMIDPTGQAFAYVIPLNGGNGNAITQAVLVWYSRVTATIGTKSQTAQTEMASATVLSALYLRIKARGV